MRFNKPYCMLLVMLWHAATEPRSTKAAGVHGTKLVHRHWDVICMSGITRPSSSSSQTLGGAAQVEPGAFRARRPDPRRQERAERRPAESSSNATPPQPSAAAPASFHPLSSRRHSKDSFHPLSSRRLPQREYSADQLRKLWSSDAALSRETISELVALYSQGARYAAAAAAADRVANPHMPAPAGDRQRAARKQTGTAPPLALASPEQVQRILENGAAAQRILVRTHHNLAVSVASRYWKAQRGCLGSSQLQVRSSRESLDL